MIVVRLPRLLVIVNMITYELWMLWMLLMWRLLLFLLLSVLHQDVRRQYWTAGYDDVMLSTM